MSSNNKQRLVDPPKGLSEPNIAPNSLEVMKKRHLLKDSKGEAIETPRQMFWRVATAMASEDSKYVKGSEARKQRVVERTSKEFYQIMAENRFLPGSRVLYEAGNKIDGTGQLSSCFVLPIEDNLESIFDTMKEAALVQKNNGGTGFNFSHIRPKGDEVGGTPNVAAGPIHFIKTFSQAFDQVLQGKKRGGGNMAILNINHPDIIDFINLKGQDDTIRNFNISVGVTDEFMNAVREDKEYDLINPRNEKKVKSLKAREVFELICEKAWECADPGLFFLDTTQNANPTKPLGVIEATNPCGEEPLRSYESCNLGSIVLPTHLVETKEGMDIDWDLLEKSAYSATHFLDNMIDLSDFPLKKIADEVEKTRKLGLGVVGLGSMFYKMGIAYNSDKAVNLAKKIIAFIQEASTKESERLATERGVFPGFEGSKWDEMGRKVRNATMTSIAPTGTLSLVSNTSSGIEPIFSLVYERKSFYQDEGQEDRKSLFYVNEEFEAYAREHDFYSEKLMKKIADNGGHLDSFPEVPAEAKKIFVTTHDIEPVWHVKMQAAAQNSVDAAVSKTINLANDASIDEVRKAYILAWESGCKGITIYRDGSKNFQVLSSSKQEENPKSDSKILHSLTENALQVLEKRALKKNDNDEINESPEQLWQRIADFVASKEASSKKKKIAKEFFDVMNDGKFYCGGTLLWAGMGEETIMSKCLVLPIDDSIDSIFQTLNMNIQCLRRGVGTGFNFSKIRSSYAKVKTTGENAAGPVEYIRMFNRAQDTIRGRGGRGLGSMAILNASHPDIEDFISCKDDLTSITHYNISVGASNDFMKAVKEDLDWELIDPSDKKVYKVIKAREMFERIAKHAWQSGDPGMYFLDRAEAKNNTPKLGTMDATNPCGEQPLIPFETCNMGHINLAKFITVPQNISYVDLVKLDLKEKLKMVNWTHLEKVTSTAVRFLDNIIDVNNYPIKEIEEMTRKTRNIGVGIMGFADILIELGITYGSEESIKLAGEIMKFIQDKSHIASEELGKEKGNFPAFNDSNWKSEKKYMRNVRTTTIAPTGTISIIADCNPGIEPIFSLGYRRKNSMGGVDQEVIDKQFLSFAKKSGFYSSELMAEIANGVHLKDIAEKYNIPANIVDVFVTTHEITPESHVQIQAVFQKYVDSAVSKTINLPNHATWQDVAKVYELAFDLECKGITIFRDGSKDPALQVGTSKKDTNTSTKEEIVSIQMPRNVLEPRKRDLVTRGKTYEVKTEQGDLYITINEDDQGIVEVFLNIGKSGSFTQGYTEALGRMISMALRSGIKPESIVKQLQGIRTSTPTLNRGMFIYSVPDAVAKILKKHIEEQREQIKMFSEQEVPEVEEELIDDGMSNTPIEPTLSSEEQNPADIEYVAETTVTTQTVVIQEDTKSGYSKDNNFGDMLDCPECGSDLEYAEGCILCRSCGYSKCG
ncbi:adenosylcobalamin-dependent ribonucleoside-diphosphate reductase [Candidatus Dojkabacteria bacterium]|uniref:Vitamin B12-dependent ribonucleotide reductase n=1 Tax=Candidatus Dojkabacteria bacterium TaxID=2099670 RepID=A0A955KZ88_9BACT|nr:adenosylcobalamin-dependent ribonucleoside-diphosphate reductase [Candidatus Dojkabacteria bacterium]